MTEQNINTKPGIHVCACGYCSTKRLLQEELKCQVKNDNCAEKCSCKKSPCFPCEKAKEESPTHDIKIVSCNCNNCGNKVDILAYFTKENEITDFVFLNDIVKNTWNCKKTTAEEAYKEVLKKKKMENFHWYIITL